jgi:23S rRNA pseudouridine2604 synthase
MCSALGFRVQGLKRVRIMHIRLGSLATGAWRNLTDAEIRPLLAAAGARATAG